MKTETSIKVSPAAAEALDSMREIITENTRLRHISRPKLADWILIKFQEQLHKSLHEIEQDHFDPLDYMSELLELKKRAKEQGGACPEYEALKADLAKLANKGPRPNRTFQSSKNDPNNCK